MKRAADGGGGDPHGGKRGRTREHYAFKILCPEHVCASIVGRGGTTVKSIQDQSGSHLNFSRRGEYFPETRLRTCIISAAEPGSLVTAVELVIDQVSSCGEDERKSIEDHDGTLAEDGGEFVDEFGNPKIRVAMCSAALRNVSHTLEEDTGARVITEPAAYEDHQLVTLSGSKENIVQAVEHLNSLTQDESEQPWFAEWAEVRTFGGGPENGKGKGKARPQRQERERPPQSRGDEASAGARRRGGDGSLKIFVGGLSQATQPDTLRSYFSKYGEIREADVRIDPQTKRSKGFGFVSFADHYSLDQCLARVEEHVIDSKWVDVKLYGGSQEQGGGGDRERDHRGHKGAGRDDRGGRRDELPQRRDEPRHRGKGGKDYREPDLAPRDAHARSAPAPALDIGGFSRVVASVPEDYVCKDYSISCVLPNSKCGALVGRKGEHVRSVEQQTGASIQLAKEDVNGGRDGYRKLEIVGPLLSVYAAHMLLMKAYNDTENNVMNEKDEEAARIEALQRQVSMLKQDLARTTAAPPARGR